VLAAKARNAIQEVQHFGEEGSGGLAGIEVVAGAAGLLGEGAEAEQNGGLFSTQPENGLEVIGQLHEELKRTLLGSREGPSRGHLSAEGEDLIHGAVIIGML
jgi:hypothetical protein